MTLNEINERLYYYCPELRNTIDSLEAIGNINSENSNINIVAYGAYNSGKSSLLNSIIGSTQEFFPTNDVPETRTNKMFEHKNICFVDTPGLDVNENDTSSANAGAARADVILFVHKLTSGSIQKQDIDALTRIYDSHANPKSVLFILTSGEVAKSNIAAIEEITHQIHTAFSDNILLLIVSNSVYQKGIQENKEKLIKISGIECLKDKLNVVIDSVKEDLIALRAKKRRLLLEEMLNAVQKLKQTKKFDMNTLNTKKIKTEKHFVQSVKKLSSVVSKKLTDIASI